MGLSVQDWGAIGEVVGAAAVIVTLIYVALQVRENSRQLRLTSTLSINRLINESFDPIYNNEKNLYIWTTGLKSPDTLAESDFEIFLLFMTRLLNSIETVVTHNRLDALDTEVFERYLPFFKGIIGTPGGEAWLKTEHNVVLSNESKKILSID